MILKIHADCELLNEQDWLCPLLLPWAEDYPLKPLWRDPTYAAAGHRYFVRSSLAECHFVVWPALLMWEADLPQVVTAARKARSQGKRLVAFYWTDMEFPLNIENLILFTTSLRASLRGPNEHAMPAFMAHHLQHPRLRLPLGPRDKSPQPTVGFCGQLDTLADSRYRIQSVLGRAVYWGLLSRPKAERLLRGVGLSITRAPGKRLRYQALGTVRRTKAIRSNFLIRDRHFDGIHEVSVEAHTKHREQALARFARNVLGSDYTLCPRGGGNYSLRFYETLCLGRIPVFINSDCVLPYEELIHWKDHCVWVEEENIETLPTAIIDHYNSLTNGKFRALQHKCRELWLDYLSLDGFFRHFHLQDAIRRLPGGH